MRYLGPKASALASKAARIAAAFCARSPGVVQPPSSYDQNHKGWRETPRLEATPASILISAGRLDVKTLGLNTPDYAPEIHYHQVRDAWKGLRVPSGQ